MEKELTKKMSWKISFEFWKNKTEISFVFTKVTSLLLDGMKRTN